MSGQITDTDVKGCYFYAKHGDCFWEGVPFYGDIGQYCREKCEHRKWPTNADRIRSMSDEDLAEWLAANNERSEVCPNFGAHYCQESCIQCWLDWLRQEVSDG